MGDRRGSLPHIDGLWLNSPVAALYPPDAWGRGSFLAIPLSVSSSIKDPHRPLTAGMYVDVPDLHRLLVPLLMSVKGLDQLDLKSEQLGGKAAVHVDIDLIHVTLALTQEFEPDKAGRHNLDGQQGRKFCLGVER